MIPDTNSVSLPVVKHRYIFVKKKRIVFMKELYGFFLMSNICISYKSHCLQVFYKYCVKLADGLLKFVQKFSVVQGNGL